MSPALYQLGSFERVLRRVSRKPTRRFWNFSYANRSRVG